MRSRETYLQEQPCWTMPGRMSRSKEFPGEREAEFVLLDPGRRPKTCGWVEVSRRQMFTPHKVSHRVAGPGTRAFLGRGEHLWGCGKMCPRKLGAMRTQAAGGQPDSGPPAWETAHWKLRPLSWGFYQTRAAQLQRPGGLDPRSASSGPLLSRPGPATGALPAGSTPVWGGLGSIWGWGKHADRGSEKTGQA